MGLLCSKETLVTHTNIEESEKNAEINRRITREHKEEQKVEKILLLGTGESGKSTIFKQIKVLFHAGFNNVELKRYIQVIHANVFQSIKILYDGSKEFAEAAGERSSYYILQPENQVLGEKFSDIGNQFTILTEELALQIEAVWKDPAIQATFQRSNELQIPDCTQFFLGNVIRLALPDYIPTQEDVLYARVRTTAIVEMEFSSPDSNRKDQIYRLCDVGGQRNERRKWIHLFDNVRAIIFCASLSEYDQTLYEDETKNRMMETKELFDKLLKESCFENTSFLVFLNKFDIFEKKVEQVPLNVCEWFNDYKYSNSGINEVDFAYEYVKGKFKEVYRQNTPPDRVCRVLRIYKTTALNRNIVKQTFDLVDETLTRWRLDQHELL